MVRMVRVGEDLGLVVNSILDSDASRTQVDLVFSDAEAGQLNWGMFTTFIAGENAPSKERLRERLFAIAPQYGLEFISHEQDESVGLLAQKESPYPVALLQEKGYLLCRRHRDFDPASPALLSLYSALGVVYDIDRIKTTVAIRTGRPADIADFISIDDYTRALPPSESDFKGMAQRTIDERNRVALLPEHRQILERLQPGSNTMYATSQEFSTGAAIILRPEPNYNRESRKYAQEKREGFGPNENRFTEAHEELTIDAQGRILLPLPLLNAIGYREGMLTVAGHGEVIAMYTTLNQ